MVANQELFNFFFIMSVVVEKHSMPKACSGYSPLWQTLPLLTTSPHFVKRFVLNMCAQLKLPLRKYKASKRYYSASAQGALCDIRFFWGAFEFAMQISLLNDHYWNSRGHYFYLWPPFAFSPVPSGSKSMEKCIKLDNAFICRPCLKWWPSA